MVSIPFPATPGAPLSWDDVVVGYDFGLLKPSWIQDWVLAQPILGEASVALASLAGDTLVGFEAALWRASAEATGRAPRPGGNRWAQAQDRWRVALLRNALAATRNSVELALQVEAVYEAVGCPEDMLELWQRPTGSAHPAPSADRGRVLEFIAKASA